MNIIQVQDWSLAYTQLHIPHGDLVRIHDHTPTIGRKFYILYADIFYIHLGKPLDPKSRFRIIRIYISNLDISELRCLFGYLRELSAKCLFIHNLRFLTGRRGFPAIVQVKTNRLGDDILHIYIMDVDVFDNTAPASCAFKADAGISANKVHIRYRNIAYTPRHLAANHKS